MWHAYQGGYIQTVNYITTLTLSTLAPSNRISSPVIPRHLIDESDVSSYSSHLWCKDLPRHELRTEEGHDHAQSSLNIPQRDIFRLTTT
jgi:hypothetical protein